MCTLVCSILQREGYAVCPAADGEEALALATRDRPDLVILDLGLPGLGGLEVCRALRKQFSGPILVLSGRSDELTIVQALDGGADDYLTKPFGISELLARLRALDRRQPATCLAECLEAGDLRIDFTRRRIHLGRGQVRLTPTEFEVLALLARNLDRVVTTQMILRRIWGRHHGDYGQTLRVHIGHIRKKIERDPTDPRYLVTEPGVGYRLQAPRGSAAATAP